ncbi:MAG: DUF6046 domain-containing protein [Prevotellaceae bacterium]|jgi:hypothetical protein|nr:DUF6046 domain-containing protein [Prevotellaceae bacterium]
MENNTKILIYTGANIANQARIIGIGLGGQAARTSLYKSAITVAQKTANLRDLLYLDDFTHAETMLENHHQRNKIILSCADDVYPERGNDSEIIFTGAKINVQKQNKVVQTELINRAGTVKEFIQEQDYNVSITGQLFAENSNFFPYDELDLLNMILTTSTHIKVASRYLSLFGVNKLVLKSANFDQNNLQYFNVMPFSLSFVSDMDYDFLVE